MENNLLGNEPARTDTTQVLGMPYADVDRTAAIEPTAIEATRMGAGVACPVCGTSNSGLETYCAECGFLLTSAPGSLADDSPSAVSAFELVEDRTGRVFPLHDGNNTVGRESCDVLLMEPTVSRRHAQIVVSGVSIAITDAGSTNGTQVDGLPVVAQTRRPASPGSSIRFGSATFTLRSTTASSPQEGEAVVEREAYGNDVIRMDTAGPPVAMPAEISLPASGIAAWLRGVAQDGRAPADIAIPLGAFTVGRRAGADHIVAGDPFVSGRHAEFRADGTIVTLTDLGSTNGTLVNGTRLKPSEPMALQEGDEISVGQGRYRLECVDDTDESAPELDDNGDDPASVACDPVVPSASELALDDDEPRGIPL